MMTTQRPFNLASTPRLYFGAGKISLLPDLVKTFGPRIALVTAAGSFDNGLFGAPLLENLTKQSITFKRYVIDREPTPGMIDDGVTELSVFRPAVVVAIGGGSVLDAGKAIAAMLTIDEPVKDYLEGVGTKNHPGTKLPFIAIPTTAGTGSEATKNAVITETGAHGYKKSLRHDNFVPDIAIVDPALTLGCPPPLTAASGMDAFTQLLESFLSTAANPITDGLAYEGLKAVSRSLMKACTDGSDPEARTDMALAAYLSGITLANAGLGLVHGFAGSLGGRFNIPHGVICSTMMAPVNKITVRKLRSEKNNRAALIKYAVAGRLFSTEEDKSDDYYIDSLLETIHRWTHEMRIPGLAQSGVTPDRFEDIVNDTDNKNNPVRLNHEEMLEALNG
ncbi:MAG TPA: iron-containing alcohol dehydrogenase [Ohtaekwangia sp.]|nr:iron-containing alcohol dehydrogenase [Ohtaekwangia sp.]